MDAKDILLKLRLDKGFSQDELAEKVFVTRQAVSRWERGETTPNTETLKLLSQLFDVSINTLLGAPRQLFCQCCGMPLEDSIISHEKNGMPNEAYCTWCYADGTYAYDNLNDLVEFCIAHTGTEHTHASLRASLLKLDYWKRYESLGGTEYFDAFKQQLTAEFNALHIDGMPRVESLNVLAGHAVNPEYRLPCGKVVRFLDDNALYLGARLACDFDDSRCFMLVAGMDFLLVCTRDENDGNPELVVYRKR